MKNAIIKQMDTTFGFLNKLIKQLTEENKKLRRQINCVKDHNRLKPHNCCYQADTLMLEEMLKEPKKRTRKVCITKKKR
jgi:K+-sensing histidine kinase KdpD